MTFTASEVKCLELNMDLDKIAASGQCFRWTPAPFPGGYIVPAGGYCATIYRLDGKIVVHEHTISHHNTLSPDAQAARAFWENYLDGAGFSARWVDLKCYLTREPDSYIARAASAARGMQILRQPPFETLISFIVSQNNNIPRIKASVEALCRRHGYRHYVPTARGNFPGAEWWDFPEPWSLTDPATLQGLGLGYRDEYVAAAARAVVSGDLDLGLLALCPYEEARARLKALPGVGDKVADCVCLYGLGHVEAFPVDVHIRRVLEREFPEGFPFEHFPGYAGFVQQLLFYYEREHTAEYRPK